MHSHIYGVGNSKEMAPRMNVTINAVPTFAYNIYNYSIINNYRQVHSLSAHRHNLAQ